MFTGNVDNSISTLWNRINLALALQCRPSEVDAESYKDMQAMKVLLSAREEYKERNRGD